MPWRKEKPIEEIKAYNRMNMARYRKNHPKYREKENLEGRKRTLEFKKQAMIKIANGIICSGGCGCNDLRILEINHIGGRSYDERSSLNPNRGDAFYKAIISGEYTKPLSILCRVCNAAEYVKRKYGFDYKIELQSS